MSPWGSGLLIWIEKGLWKRSFLFRAIQNHRKNRKNMRFGGLLLCNATSDRLETSWVTPWGSGLLIWIETGLWKQGVSFLELFKVKDKTGHIWVFGGLLLCNATSDRLETGWVTPWGSGLSIWIEIGLWKQRVYFLELSKIKDKISHKWVFGGLLFCNWKSDSPDIEQMTFWSGVLLIKSETFFVETGSFLFITMWIYR